MPSPTRSACGYSRCRSRPRGFGARCRKPGRGGADSQAGAAAGSGSAPDGLSTDDLNRHPATSSRRRGFGGDSRVECPAVTTSEMNKREEREMVGTITRRGLMGAFALAATVALSPAGALGQDKPRIKIGFIGPVSGGNAAQGLGAQNGFLLAIEQANAGDYPYAVEGVALDDASDPQTGVGAAMAPVNDGEVGAADGRW